MKKVSKMKKLKVTRWSNLTLGEKVLKVITTLIKIALVVAVIGVVIAGVFSIGVGILVAFGIASAISGGFRDASHAYRPGDIHVTFWR